MSAVSGAKATPPEVIARPTVSKSRLGPWQPYDALFVVLAMLIGPLLVAFLVYLLGRVGLVSARIGNIFLVSDPIASLVQYSTALAIEVGIIFTALHWRKASLADLGLRRFHPGWIGAVLGLYVLQAVLVILVFAIVQVLSPTANLDQAQEVLAFGTSHPAVIGSFITAVLVAPALEEIMFRGIIFVGLARVWPTWLAALLSAALFGWLHGQLNVGLYTFVFGLLLIWLYTRSRSLIPGILLHMLNNAVAFWLLAGNRF